MSEESAPHIASAPAPTRSRERAVLALLGMIRASSSGDQAALRRGGPRAYVAFYRIASDVLEDVLSDTESRRVERERRWALVAELLAKLDTLASPSIQLGRALFDAKVSEMRLLRLVRADGDALEPVLRHVIHQLVSNGQPASPIDIAELILATHPDEVERIRRRIAKDYFSAEHKADSGSTKGHP